MKKRLLIGVISVFLAVSMIPCSSMEMAGVKINADAAETLGNPRIEADSTLEAGQKVTYDCVWFGSYPQTEIVDKPETSGIYQMDWKKESDYEVNASLYDTLKNATQWDNNGVITINGKKYRRLKKSEATAYSSGSGNYNWDSEDYHYFRYDKIKWRVLNNSGNKIFLLADKILDDQKYNTILTETTWSTSTVRSWLNGYDSSSNSYGSDYSNDNFLDNAFTLSEQKAIITTEVINKDNIQYSTPGGENSQDKIFLLSESEVSTDQGSNYGFTSDCDLTDESRMCKSSTYAKAMGVWTYYVSIGNGNGRWLLRSPGVYQDAITYVHYNGYLDTDGAYVYADSYGIRPTLVLDSSYSSYYCYAGTVCTDGMVTEDGSGIGIASSYSVKYDANGGWLAPAIQTKIEGMGLTLTTDIPEREGYTFLGWGRTNDSTNPIFRPGEVYKVDASIKLYAVWMKRITLTYDSNGGIGNPDPESIVLYNTETKSIFNISKNSPVKNGYRFLGWSRNKDAISAEYSPGDAIELSLDQTLYAVWEEGASVTYTISYNANGGEGAPSAQTKAEGTSVILSNTKPTRNGYEFVGWGIDETSTTVTYNLGDNYDKDEDITLYAVWKKTITLTYNANGGSGSPSTQTATIYNSANNYTFTVSSISPSRSDYSFQGWGTSADSEEASYHSGDKITIDSDSMIYAVWKKVEEGGESGSDDPVQPTPQPIIKRRQTITASNKTVPINNAAFSLGARTNGDSKLTYKSSNTKVAIVSIAGKVTVKGYGIANITVTAAETSAYIKTVKTVNITVVPKRMKLKSVKSPGKGKLQAKWVKDKTATGYHIQFSRDMDFKRGVYQKSVSRKLTSLKKPVTGLDRKKKYYVRIRAYKKVGGKTLYGIWSYGKVVKIK